LPRSSTLGWVEHVNLTDGAMVKQMFPVLLTFYGSVYSNMKARPLALPMLAPERTRPNPARPGGRLQRRAGGSLAAATRRRCSIPPAARAARSSGAQPSLLAHLHAFAKAGER